jgi:hypothetical protein
VSWKPLVKSKKSATATTTISVRLTSISAWGNPWFPHEPPPSAERRGGCWRASRADEPRFGGGARRP